MADTAIQIPSAGSLGFTGFETLFVNSGDCRLVFSSSAPTLIYVTKQIPVPSASLILSGKLPARGIGLQFETYAPSLFIEHKASVSVASLGLSGNVPESVIAAPPSKTVAPFTGSIGFTGFSANLNVLNAQPGTGSISYTGQTIANVSVTSPAYPFFDQLQLTGQPVKISIGNIGRSIVNPNATFDSKHRYTIDDHTGFKVKVKHGLSEQWDGLMTTQDHYDVKHPQLQTRSRREKLRQGAVRPDDTRREQFIEDAVTVDDL